jgi:hypothetical protein
MTSPPEGIAIKFWVPNTPAIFSIASAAATGITAPLRKGGQSAALISVVFAAASLEALLNEAAYLAELDLHKAVEPGVVSAFVQMMDEAEESKAQIQSKFQLARLALTGKAYGKGTAPYQDFSLLIAARNALLHLKSKEYFSSVDGKPAVFNQVILVDKLSSKNILAELPPGGDFHMSRGSTAQATAEPIYQGRIVGSENVPYKSSSDALRASWTFLIGTKAVAEWACKAAADMALDFIGKAPNGMWKTRMEGHFSKAFSAGVPL